MRRIRVVSFFLLFFLSFFNQADAKIVTIYASWDQHIDHNYDDFVGYWIYYSSSRIAVENRTAPKVNVGKKTSVCLQLDDTFPVYFIGVEGVNRIEGGLTIGYYLFGNIVGTYNDGMPSTSARIDASDLVVLADYLRIRKTGINHPVYDCQGNFVVIPETEEQRVDLNEDGKVDYIDFFYVTTRMGNGAE